MTERTSYANAWLEILPQAHIPNLAAQAVARECARYADWKTGANVRPGRRRLAWNLNISEATVKRALQDLVSHGLLVLVQRGGAAGPQRLASVYQLSVPAHLATTENLATFPDSAAVCIVKAQKKGQPKHPDMEPERFSVGHRRPTENPTTWQAPVGHIRPSQWVAGDPPPSIDPPGSVPTERAALAAVGVAGHGAEENARTDDEIAADGIAASWEALRRSRPGGTS